MSNSFKTENPMLFEVLLQEVKQYLYTVFLKLSHFYYMIYIFEKPINSYKFESFIGHCSLRIDSFLQT